MAYLGLRYRDLPHALNAIFSLLFIVTPVIYPQEILMQKGVYMLIYANPFASLIEVVRFPIIKHTLAPVSQYFAATGFVLLMFILQRLLTRSWRRLVPFWA